MNRVVLSLLMSVLCGLQGCNSFNYGFQAANTPYFYKRLEGKIGEDNAFTLYLHRQDTALSGLFYEHKARKVIVMKGKIDSNNNFQLQTSAHNPNKFNLIGLLIADKEDIIKGKAGAHDMQTTFQMKENYEGAVAFNARTYAEKTDGCSNESKQQTCATINIHFPELVGLKNTEAMSAINDTIQAILTHNQPPEKVVNEYVQGFLNAKEGTTKTNYYHRASAEVLLNEQNYLSVVFTHENYSGGAHGSFTREFRNFNLKNGKVLNWQDIFLPNSQLGLKPVAEAYFRKQQKIGDKSWDEAGYWFENNEFQLSNKFVLLKDRIRFEYNEYEIAPYVMGAPVVEIPYQEISEYLKPEIKALLL